MAIKKSNVAKETAKKETVEDKHAEIKIATKTNIKKPAPKASFFVYIGPTIRGLISENAVFDANDKNIYNKIKLEPRIKHMLIADEQIGEARAALKNNDGYLAKTYKELANKA